MIYERFMGGVLCHHGVKGQKWGVRRTPEQLGHVSPKKDDVDKIQTVDTIYGEAYRSEKGFTVAKSKLTGYCLDPEGKHSKEFFDVGYTPKDSELLFRHLEENFEVEKKSNVKTLDNGAEKFVIPMELGVSIKKMFTTAWRVDSSGNEPRFTSAYRDRRLGKGK